MPSLTARIASESDRDLLLAWRNDPDARASSFTTHEIGSAEHYAWFARKVADPACTLLMLDDEQGEPVAHVRFDAEADGSAEVSITVAPAARGRGIGTAALRAGAGYASEHQVADRLTAQVKDDNPASSRAFIAAGFAHTGTTGGVERYELALSRP